MAFDDTQTERLVLVAGCSVLLGLTIPIYLHLTEPPAVSGVEISTFEHVKAFVLSGLIVVAFLIVIGLGLGLVGWSLTGLMRVARRVRPHGPNHRA